MKYIAIMLLCLVFLGCGPTEPPAGRTQPKPNDDVLPFQHNNVYPNQLSQ